MTSHNTRGGEEARGHHDEVPHTKTSISYHTSIVLVGTGTL